MRRWLLLLLSCCCCCVANLLPPTLLLLTETDKKQTHVPMIPAGRWLHTLSTSFALLCCTFCLECIGYKKLHILFCLCVSHMLRYVSR
uniref:Secreted protein n=1 Tax=Anopheles darlingi TaxID=43151 RepID=A0A2M4DBV9_ANODA